MATKKEVEWITPFKKEFKYGVVKVGFKDQDGKVVIRPKYEEWGTPTEFVGGLITFVKEPHSLHGIINIKGKILIDDAYNTGVHKDGVGVYETLSNNRGAIDKEGNALLPCKYKYLNYLGDGFFFFDKNYRDYGILEVDFTNRTSSVKLDMKAAGYSHPGGLYKLDDLCNKHCGTCSENGCMIVKRNDFMGLLYHGEEVLPCDKYTKLSKWGTNGFRGSTGEEGKSFLIDVTDPHNIKTEIYNP